MTRVLLALLLSGATLAVGVATCLVQCRNHELAGALDRTKRSADLVRAGNEELSTEIVSELFGLEEEWRRGASSGDLETAELPTR